MRHLIRKCGPVGWRRRRQGAGRWWSAWRAGGPRNTRHPGGPPPLPSSMPACAAPLDSLRASAGHSQLLLLRIACSASTAGSRCAGRSPGGSAVVRAPQHRGTALDLPVSHLLPMQRNCQSVPYVHSARYPSCGNRDGSGEDSGLLGGCTRTARALWRRGGARIAAPLYSLPVRTQSGRLPWHSVPPRSSGGDRRRSPRAACAPRPPHSPAPAPCCKRTAASQHAQCKLPPVQCKEGSAGAAGSAPPAGSALGGPSHILGVSRYGILAGTVGIGQSGIGHAHVVRLACRRGRAGLPAGRGSVGSGSGGRAEGIRKQLPMFRPSLAASPDHAGSLRVRVGTCHWAEAQGSSG